MAAVGRLRMPLVHGFIGRLFLVGLGATGVVVVWASLHEENWQGLQAFLGNIDRFEAGCAAIGMFCMGIIYTLAGTRVRARTKQLSFDNEGGTVSISTEAICDYIMKLTPEFPSVMKLTPEVVASRGAIDLVVGVRIKAGPQIHEVCELLQQRVRESVTNGLGISDIRRIEVSVAEIVSEHKPA